MVETLHLKGWLLLAIGNLFLKALILVLAVLPHTPAQMLSRWLSPGLFLQSFFGSFCSLEFRILRLFAIQAKAAFLHTVAKCVFQGKLFAPSTRKPRWLLPLTSLYPSWGMSKHLSDAHLLVYIHFKAIYLSAACSEVGLLDGEEYIWVGDAASQSKTEKIKPKGPRSVQDLVRFKPAGTISEQLKKMRHLPHPWCKWTQSQGWGLGAPVFAAGGEGACRHEQPHTSSSAPPLLAGEERRERHRSLEGV